MVPRPTNGPRALGPITTRSAQGIATTGRYAANQGAAKVISPYDDPYAYQDSSPLHEPVPARTPVRTTPARDPNADDGSTYTPANVDKEAMLSPEMQQQAIDAAKDFVGNRFKDAAIQGGTVSTAATLAGLPSNVSIGAGLATGANALTSLSPMGLAIGYGLPALNEFAPMGVAHLNRSWDIDTFEDEFGVEVGPDMEFDASKLSPERRLAAEDRMSGIKGTFNNLKRPLTEQIAETAPVQAAKLFARDWIINPVNRYLIDPALEAVGLRDMDEENSQKVRDSMDARAAAQARREINQSLGFAQPMDDPGLQQSFDAWDTPQHMRMSFDAPMDVPQDQRMSFDRPAESIAETAMDEAGRSPDFAQSDYSYNPQMSHEQNMEAMAQQEREAENKAQEREQKEKEVDKAKAKAKARTPNSHEMSGLGSKGHMSTGGGPDGLGSQKGVASGSNPGGFGASSGGSAGQGFGQGW
ncbi:hypothetical protein Desaf_3439 [Desulfocurvibacter africanus subsp. africanus str. Walvis Bay]|uniref:Uncharacterized protein n=2 Tax=Desulfocurvibacter africanus TaxID=873 RepID=F3YXE8_DESAF|nr:hypothetical protein Desaf_3439 [Desulfocurvibacter africanus subsp. africanus str. Walvis Bay]